MPWTYNYKKKYNWCKTYWGIKMKDKIYVGDGVYAQQFDYGIGLTTEDGVCIQNAIFLEWGVFNTLVKLFMKE